MLGANLQIEDQLSSMLCVVNAPGNDTLTNEQTRLFQAAARHIARAVRIHRQLWTLDHLNGSTPERFEGLRQGAILVDAAANVLFINSAARAILETGGGLIPWLDCARRSPLSRWPTRRSAGSGSPKI